MFGPGAGRRAAFPAFSLAELLIVIAVLAILAAMLMPALWKVWAMVGHHQCTRNLAHLHQAIGMRRAEAAESPLADVKARSWPSQILPYLEYDRSFLICPVSAAGGAEIVDTDEPPEPGGTFSPSGGDTGLDEDDEEYIPDHYTELTELVELCLGGHTYVPLAEGPWVVKLSEAQVQAAQSRGYLRGDGMSNLQGAMDTTYRAGSDPSTYWLCFEDVRPSGGDKDFNDTMIRVHDNQNGTYELTLSGHTGGAHSLVSRPDHQPIMALPRGSYYQGVTVTVGVEEVDPETGREWGGESDPWAWRGDDPDAPDTTRLVVATNYGMPGDTKYLTARPGAIALLDYARYVAHCDDVWSDPEVDPDHDGVPRFARHDAQIHVLLTDGSVRPMWPHEINPAYPDAYRQYWAP
jgi:Tfp pilus assembly protein PilE